MVAEDAKRSIADIVEGTGRKDKGGAGTIDFLTDLTGGLPVDVEIFQRK